MDLGYKLNNNTYQGIFTTALPELKALLRDFEKNGYPEMRMNMVQTVLVSHKHLRGLEHMYVITFLTSFHLTFASY